MSLMFLIGLKFSLPKLRVMLREVFGLGSSQVADHARGLRRAGAAAIRLLQG